ncbi:hypothetical protein ACFVXG_20750 [Kitasatospora sp. NPDC058162]|uniref:hypothetical protein n=1 Tax=Kitasatospora sp. NPDC058162 TaxID=3346362 RepID=UPI0036D7D005
MGMVLRAESALIWFLRAALRYLIALVCGWGAVGGGLALFAGVTGGISGAELLSGEAVLGLMLLLYFGSPSLVLLLLTAPKRESEHYRAVLAVVLCGPAILCGLFLGGWGLIGLILFQTGFVGLVLPSPRLRLVSRRDRGAERRG